MKNGKYFFYIFLTVTAVLLTKSMACGAKDIWGTVISMKENTALEGVIITLRRSDGAILAFGQTGKDGQFRIQADIPEADSAYLEISLMGYRTLSIRNIPENPVTVKMEEKPLTIPEVTIKAKKMEISGDTIRYSVPAMLEQGDRELGDVLSRITGINVDREGYVKYLGRDISIMYIDSTDLLESRYNLAVKNIDPKDIKSIEIYERHQHIKTLQGKVRPDNAAINILMKDNAKGKWIAAVNAAAGGSTQKPWVPYSAGAFLMNIGRKIQTFNTIGTDATGNRIAVSVNPTSSSMILESRDFHGQYELPEYLSISHSKAPIDDSRTRFNTTYSASTDNKFKIGNTTVGVSGKYEHESLSSESSVRNIYENVEGGTDDFTEINSVSSAGYYGSAAMSAEVNSKKLYLKDKMRIEFKGEDASGHLDGSALRDQNAGNRNFNFINSAKFTRPVGDRNILMIDMLTQYGQNSEKSNVINPEDSTDATQNTEGKFFYNTLSFGYALRIGKRWTLTTKTQLDYLFRRFSSGLHGLEFPETPETPPLDNNLSLQYIRPSEDLYLEFSHGKFTAALAADIWYQYTNCLMGSRMQDNSMAANPYMMLKYTFGPRFSISAYAGYSLSKINEQQIYDGLIMINYKYLLQGRTELAQTPDWYTNLSLKFSEPASGWVLNATANYSADRSFRMTRYFIDDYIVNVQSNDIADYTSVMAVASVSKTFLDIGAKITAGFNFSNTGSSINQDGILYQYTGRSYGADLSFICPVSTWMNIDYDGTYNFCRYRTDGTWDGDGNHSSTHMLTLSFYPAKKFEISLDTEYYIDKAPERDLQQTVFLDASARFSATEKISIYIKARNLLDSRTYSYSMLMPLQSVYYEYSIRPLNVLLGLEVRF